MYSVLLGSIPTTYTSMLCYYLPFVEAVVANVTWFWFYSAAWELNVVLDIIIAK